MNHKKNIGLQNPELEKYIGDHSDAEDPQLQELFRQTHLKLYHPRRTSDHQTGLFLKTISQMIRPNRILEIGTFSGYGTLCLAKGLKESGLIHTIEINDEMESFIQETFNKSGYCDQIVLHIGDAKEIIPELNEKFDLVFIDAEKDEYCQYYDLIFDKLAEDAYILADNVLWSGKVLEDNLPNNDNFTKGILAFNKKIQNDPRVENFILPLYDGIMIIKKKAISPPPITQLPN